MQKFDEMQAGQWKDDIQFGKMITRNLCRLCWTENEEIIEISGEAGIQMNIERILLQHFWFLVSEKHNDAPQSKVILLNFLF